MFNNHKPVLDLIIDTQKECLLLLRKVVDILQLQNTALQTKVELLQREREIAQNNFEWARVRLNHIEDERAALLWRVVGMSVPTPKVERGGQESMAETKKTLDDVIGQLTFEDVGDEKARELGVDHEG